MPRRTTLLLLAAVAAASALASTTAAAEAPAPAPLQGRRRSSSSAAAAAKASSSSKAAAKKAAENDPRLAGTLDASPCAPKVNFFPEGAEEASSPPAWGMAKQRAAGNPYSDRLLPVVLGSGEAGGGGFADAALPPAPVLQLEVSHPLLAEPGTLVKDLSCMTVRSASARGHTFESAASNADLISAATADEDEEDTDEEVLSKKEERQERRAAARATAAAAAQRNNAAEVQEQAQQQDEPERPTATTTIMRRFFGRRGSSSSRRKLQQVAPVSDYMSRPATYTVTWSLNGTHTSTSTYAYGEVAGVDRLRPRLTLPELATIPDGYYCLKIIVTLQPGTGLVGQTQEVPAAPMYVVKQVCFAKLDRPVMGSVSFDGCGAPFAMLLSNATLPAMPLVPANPGAGVLGITAFKVRAWLNRTDDATPLQDTAVREVTKWFLLDRPLPSKTTALRYRPAPQDVPVSGLYNLDVESAFVTNRPDLVAFAPDGVYAADDLTIPAALRGQQRFLSGVWSTNMTGMDGLILLQPEATRAFADMTGPADGEASTNGAQVQFTWLNEGRGAQYCWKDGALSPNDDKSMCRSPFDSHVNIVGKNHTLAISFTDACGAKYAREIEFGTFGWAITKEIKAAARRAKRGVDVSAAGYPLLAEAGAAGDKLQPESGALSGGHGGDAGEFGVAPPGAAGGGLARGSRRGRGGGARNGEAGGKAAGAAVVAAAAAVVAGLML